ncbi:YheC/YheD family protein [Bacillaceae bacterium IKA-2]|nr:YheC/YheD family protein [Bacillaceae bacterium IKA-2]
MFLRKIIIHVEKNTVFENPQEIKISRGLCKQWKLKAGVATFLQFGQSIETVTIFETVAHKVPTIEISALLAEKLAIPFEILPIHCLYKQDENKLSLGPVITCITNQMYHEKVKFGSMTTFFEELARYAKHNHILFYILPLTKWEQLFYGYTIYQDEWQKLKLPEPNSVYNRISSRDFEMSNFYTDFSLYLQEKNINYFNRSFFNKWDIHVILASFPEMHPYLPNTSLFAGYDTFAEIITVYKSIFIKPIHGSQGRQILRIEKEENEYTVYYPSFSSETSTIFRSSYLLYNRLKERLKSQPFIVQQGLDLIQINECPVDFRILCVKNTKNQWQVVSSVARISAKKKMVSNLAQGGEQKRPLEVLTEIYDEKLAKQYLKLMAELALEVAKIISENLDGLFGELGVDIALDNQGKLWIIEVNSKPSKRDSDLATKQIRPSSRAIINYLAYLAGFSL